MNYDEMNIDELWLLTKMNLKVRKKSLCNEETNGCDKRMEGWFAVSLMNTLLGSFNFAVEAHRNHRKIQHKSNCFWTVPSLCN